MLLNKNIILFTLITHFYVYYIFIQNININTFSILLCGDCTDDISLN